MVEHEKNTTLSCSKTKRIEDSGAADTHGRADEQVLDGDAAQHDVAELSARRLDDASLIVAHEEHENHRAEHQTCRDNSESSVISLVGFVLE